VAGHISYPRTAAIADAWANYRHATVLADLGAIEAAIEKLEGVIGDPIAPERLKRLAGDLFSQLYVRLQSLVKARVQPAVEISPAGVVRIGSIDLLHVLLPDFQTSVSGVTVLRGLHHIEGEQNLAKGRVTSLLNAPDLYGVYEAIVEARNPVDDAIYQKFSTMFPDDYTRSEVVDCIANALRFGRGDVNGHIIGPSSRGFDISIRGRTASCL
jgi:hypothetical protein